jgi:hypothetical protein
MVGCANNDTLHIMQVFYLIYFSALLGALYENHVMKGVAPICLEQIEVLCNLIHGLATRVCFVKTENCASLHQ